MLIIFYFIDQIIVPLRINTGIPYGPFITGVAKVVVSGILIFLWLFSWNKLVEIYFWKTIRKKDKYKNKN